MNEDTELDKLVISLCDYTGNLLKPWAQAGYNCLAIDIQHQGSETLDGIHYVKADIRDCISNWLPISRQIKIAFGAPPCTHTAVLGAKHFLAKGSAKAAEAFALIARVEQLLKYFDCPYFWEQPVATTSTYVGKPTHTFNPCDYGGYLDDPSSDQYTKRTCLWSGNGFNMPIPKRVEPIDGSKMHRLYGGISLRTKNLRSATPKGFATAVYEANKNG